MAQTPDYRGMQRRADIERMAQEAVRIRKARMKRQETDDAYDQGYEAGFEDARRLYGF